MRGGGSTTPPRVGQRTEYHRVPVIHAGQEISSLSELADAIFPQDLRASIARSGSTQPWIPQRVTIGRGLRMTLCDSQPVSAFRTLLPLDKIVVVLAPPAAGAAASAADLAQWLAQCPLRVGGGQEFLTPDVLSEAGRRLRNLAAGAPLLATLALGAPEHLVAQAYQEAGPSARERALAALRTLPAPAQHPECDPLIAALARMGHPACAAMTPYEASGTIWTVSEHSYPIRTEVQWRRDGARHTTEIWYRIPEGAQDQAHCLTLAQWLARCGRTSAASNAAELLSPGLHAHVRAIQERALCAQPHLLWSELDYTQSTRDEAVTSPEIPSRLLLSAIAALSPADQVGSALHFAAVALRTDSCVTPRAHASAVALLAGVIAQLPEPLIADKHGQTVLDAALGAGTYRRFQRDCDLGLATIEQLCARVRTLTPGAAGEAAIQEHLGCAFDKVLSARTTDRDDPRCWGVVDEDLRFWAVALAPGIELTTERFQRYRETLGDLARHKENGSDEPDHGALAAREEQAAIAAAHMRWQISGARKALPAAPPAPAQPPQRRRMGVI